MLKYSILYERMTIVGERCNVILMYCEYGSCRRTIINVMIFKNTECDSCCSTKFMLWYSCIVSVTVIAGQKAMLLHS